MLSKFNFDWDKEHGYFWFHKFLVFYKGEIHISYYPDYENPKWWIKIWWCTNIPKVLHDD